MTQIKSKLSRLLWAPAHTRVQVEFRQPAQSTSIVRTCVLKWHRQSFADSKAVLLKTLSLSVRMMKKRTGVEGMILEKDRG